MELKIKTVRPSARVPAYATPGSAGQRVMIPTGIAIELPGPDYVAVSYTHLELES